MMEVFAPLIVFAVLVMIVLAVMTSAIRILPEYQRLVVFRFGRYTHTAGPGIVMLMPLIDNPVKVDLREQSQNVTVAVSTGDFLKVSIDFGWRYKVIDPEKMVMMVAGNLETAVREVVESTLRPAIGALTADQLRFERAAISETIRSRLQSIAEQRGVTITHAEIKEIVRA